jgi:hypothetical protein
LNTHESNGGSIGQENQTRKYTGIHGVRTPKPIFPSQTPGFNANDPANKEQGLDRPKFVQKIPGFGFGGPIIKNKTFFFVNFQWLRTLVTQINTNPVYTALSRQGILRFVDLNSPIWSQQAYIDNGCLNVQLAI